MTNRKRHRVCGRGNLEFLESDNDKVLAYLREGEDEMILVVANLTGDPCVVELDLIRFEGLRPIDTVGTLTLTTIGKHPYPLRLGPNASYRLCIDGAETATTSRTWSSVE
jgi:maltose alpha-D-glucosyltransferase/alpha-amylase